MYGVNASVPKTLVRHLVEYAASETGNAVLKGVLEDILATPVSPELLPPVNGEIAQCTEELVGPYELHDFYLYHVVRKGERPAKIFRLAQIAFEGRYDQATLLKWLKSFYWRFLPSSLSAVVCPTAPRWVRLPFRPGETGGCPAMRWSGSGGPSWMRLNLRRRNAIVTGAGRKLKNGIISVKSTRNGYTFRIFAVY